MSTVQTIDLVSTQQVQENQAATKKMADSILIDLQHALETILHSKADAPDAQVQATVSKHLINIGKQLKALHKENSSFPKQSIDTLFYFVGMLGQDEVTNAQMESFLGQTNNALSAANAKNVFSSSKETRHKIEEQEHQPWWKKLLDAVVKIVMPVVMITVGIVTMQPELVAATVLTTTLSATGALSKMGDAITKGLEDIGVSENAAKLVGGLLTVAVTFVASLGVGAAASIEEIGEDAAKSLTVNIKKMFSVGLMGGSIALATEAPQIVEGIVNMLPISDDAKEKVGLALLVVFEVVAVVGTIAGGAMAMSSSGENAIGSAMKKVSKKVGGILSEKLPGVMGFIAENSETIMSTARYTEFTAMALGGGAQIGISGYQLNQASIENALGGLYGSMIRSMRGIDFAQENNKQVQATMNEQMQQFGDMQQEASDIFQSYDAAAAALLM